MNIHFPTSRISVPVAEQLCREHFGIRGQMQELPGEMDKNFFLKGDDGRLYVFKIANPQAEPAIIALQHRILEHLHKKNGPYQLQQVCYTPEGKSIVEIQDEKGDTYRLHLLSYLSGKLWAKVKPQTDNMQIELGRLLGNINLDLRDFSDPAAHRTLRWDLAQAAWVKTYLHHIKDPGQLALAQHFLDLFEQSVAPALPRLRKSVIYNDANDYNIVVNGPNISVIDFGDAIYTQTICDLAIACAYAMLDQPDPLSVAAHLVRGHHEVFPLEEAEVALLFPLIATRLLISVTNSAFQRAAEPDNEYLLISERPAWDLLQKLKDIPISFAHCTLRHACGWEPHPNSLQIVGWLQSQSGQFHPLTRLDPRADAVHVLDLSIGSTELGNYPDFGEAARFDQKVNDLLRQSGAKGGLGRYNEARPIYTTPAFRTEGNNGPEWRTIHIGLDVFLEAGSAVYAPLEGCVHSFRNNAAERDYGPTILLEHRTGDGTPFYTLYGHLSLDSLDGLYVGKKVRPGEEIARLGDRGVNGQWPPHLHFQIMTDLLGKSGDFPGVVFSGELPVWRSICPDPNLIAGFSALAAAPIRMEAAEILEKRRAHIGKNLSVSYQRPLHIVRGYRQFLYDQTGRAYLDTVNNVAHVGHCHPEVVAAGMRQMSVLNTNTRYLHENLVRYAEMLTATLPDPLSVCFFVNSGSEANELALRLARTHTGRHDMVVVDVGYHGNTNGVVEISSYKFDGPGGKGPAAHIHKTPLPDAYRGIYRGAGVQVGAQYAAHIGEAIRDAAQAGREVAGFICESIISCGGQIVLPEGYLASAYRQVREAGGVCIADEVQVGFGRVGSHFWGFELQGVIPDIVTMGKPIGNGHPLGAVVTTPAIADSFFNGMEYFNTYGGNPVSCAIGMSVLEVIRREGLQAHALETGQYLTNGLLELMGRYPVIGDVRGPGLFVGFELVEDRETLRPAPGKATYLANRMRDHAILMSTDGPFHNVLKIKPPLVMDRSDVDFLIGKLDKVFGEDLMG